MIAGAAENDMDGYILYTVDYDYKTLNHEGFGGVCKYIAAPKRVGYSRLLVKHENIQSACNTFMCSRLAELCGVYTPKAYLMSTSNETRRLFPMHPFIVGTEWVEDFSTVDYGSIKESMALRQQYLDSMALYAMFCRIADTPQFAYQCHLVKNIKTGTRKFPVPVNFFEKKQKST